MAHVSNPEASAVGRHRRRRREQGLSRVELQLSQDDARLIRSVTAALADPARAEEARAVLLARFAPAPPRSFKELLAAAPLDGIELERDRDTGRVIAF